MFRKLCKEEEQRRHQNSNSVVLQEELEMEVNEMEECKLMEEKKKEAGEALVNKVAKLDAVLSSELNCCKQDMEKRNTALLQNITNLQNSQKLCEEQEKFAEPERESLMRDRKKLEKRVAQLEATLASKNKQQEQEKKTIKERTVVLLQNITRLEDFINLLGEQDKIKALERESLLRDREQLQKRVDQLEATLASEREHQQQEKEKMEENTNALLQNIVRFEASLNLLEEREKTKALERESLLRDREQLQKRVDQLEATLASEHEHQEQEKEKTEENNTAFPQNISRFESSLNVLEEREKTKALERESLLSDREQLQTCVDQLEATLASEQDQQNQQKEKTEEDTAALLQNITRFEASLNLLEERVQEYEEQDASNKNSSQ